MKDEHITIIKDAQQLVKSFAERNNWKDIPNVDKFDHLHEELIEMSQHLRYKTEDERKQFVEENKGIFVDGIGDLFFGTCRLANQLGVDIEAAFNLVKKEILAKYNHTNPENNLTKERRIIKHIVFDWSGTVSDDFTPVYEASMIVFKQLDRESISQEEYKREFTLPYMNFWNKYFPELTKEKQDGLFNEAIHQVREPLPYERITAILKLLKAQGITMIVISSHPHEKLLKEANEYGIFSLFQEINGSIHDKTEAILSILQRNNFAPQETLYIGDMTHDVDAGKKAEVLTAAVGWGYQTEDQLKKTYPDYYLSKVSDLLQLIEKPFINV